MPFLTFPPPPPCRLPPGSDDRFAAEYAGLPGAETAGSSASQAPLDGSGNGGGGVVRTQGRTQQGV